MKLPKYLIPSQFYGSTMEENSNSSSQNHNGQLSSDMNVVLNKRSGNNNDDAKIERSQYSVPNILHFIEHEWTRFELERSQWELDKAEFQARIAFLQGEKKSQEQLKDRLVRKLKMLEYALNHERERYYKLQHDIDSGKLSLVKYITPPYQISWLKKGDMEK